MQHAILTEDMHVHSQFSDGKGTIRENILAAEARGLRRLGCVDHVRADTLWIPAFLDALRFEQRHTAVRLLAGVEAKFLDESGRLDLPAEAVGAAYLYAADHRMPWKNGTRLPVDVRRAIEKNEVTPDEVIARLVSATLRTMERYSHVVVAHLFSILPKMGLSEADVSHSHLMALATTARRTGTIFEVDERWRCPGLRAVRALASTGVTIWWSTDSHRPSTIACYSHVDAVFKGLQSIAPPPVHGARARRPTNTRALADRAPDDSSSTDLAGFHRGRMRFAVLRRRT